VPLTTSNLQGWELIAKHLSLPSPFHPFFSEEELQRALKLSKEEEEKRIRELEMANQNALFDDSINLDGPNVSPS